MKTTIVILCLVLSSTAVASCGEQSKTTDRDKDSASRGKERLVQVDVLNLGLFHMRDSPDANIVTYDTSNEKNLQQIKSVCRKLAQFKPTVICVEIEPQQQRLLEREYEAYRRDPSLATQFEGEVQLLGFEIGRLADAKRIVAIDHDMRYNHLLGDSAKQIGADEHTVALIQDGLEARLKEFVAPVSNLQQTLLYWNTQEAYEFLINYNADKLVYVNSKDGFEGADEAAKYYLRNLRMFANINKIPRDRTDRLLVISGGSHAAFFDMFMKRSPGYRLVKLETFLK